MVGDSTLCIPYRDITIILSRNTHSEVICDDTHEITWT